MQLLRDFIIKEINKKGEITFAEYMQTVLYHPVYGYYNSDTERMGRFGDYYTSPTVHRMFGELIAKQLEEMWQILGGGTFTVVEMGANRGWLCHDIVQYVKKENPQFYDNFRYIIVESNPFAKEKQRALLNSLITTKMNVAHETAQKKNYFNHAVVQRIPSTLFIGNKETQPAPLLSEEKGLGEKVSWHSYTDDGFSFGQIQGCFLSNEFVDALPVHRLKLKNKVLKETYVGYNGANFYEIDNEVSEPALRDYLETNQIYLTEGQSCEVNLCAIKWLRHVSDKLNRGFIITIDYGDTTDKLYDESNYEGTARCYYKHNVNHDYYERMGEQDVTSHVNFTGLMNAGESMGLKVTGFTKQSHFLIALGILDELNTIHNDIEAILKIKNLFHPEGMGEIFKVLIQHKNIENHQLTSLRPLQSITW
ncbi:MAG: SAM-dependent methyltransferase [Candidatus Brocadia sp.]|nr:SAM-dependent methyltransferase [Candidatus Brocadia sp.]